METTRRSAFKQPRNPSGHLTGTPTELAVLELLRDYRYLPSTHIKAGLPNGSQYIEDVLPNLVEKHYIGIPEKARDRCKTKAVPFVYEVLPRGLAFLAMHGRPSVRAIASNWFEHDFLTCCIQFSFDIAVREVPGLAKRTPQSILDHENCPAETRESAAPFVIPTEPPLIFDADPFGFELNGRLVFFHGFETDNRTHKLADLESKIDRAAQYLDEKMPVSMFGIPTRLMHFAFITRSEDRMENIMRFVPDRYADRFHFKYSGGFDTKFPPATGHMVLDPWHQKDGSTWSILEHLGGADVRREEGSPRQRAGAGD